MARTLLQMKNAPIHKIKPSKSSAVYTWCGLNPFRRNVTSEGYNAGIKIATCKACLKEESKGD